MDSVTLPSFDFAKAFESWDKIFDGVLKNFEAKAAEDRQSRYRAPIRAQQPDIPEPTPASDDGSATGVHNLFITRI